MLVAGQTFTRWTILQDQRFEWDTHIPCRCVCGTKRKVLIRALRSETSKSCGCLSREITSARTKGSYKYSVAIGDQFRRLTVRRIVSMGEVHCVCSCGGKRVTTALALVKGHTASCGCLSREHTRALSAARGDGSSRNSLYPSWKMLVAATTDPASPYWRNYGARGVRMHEPWVRSLQLFISEVEAELGPRVKGTNLRRKGERGAIEPGNLCYVRHGEFPQWGSRKHSQRDREFIVARLLSGETQREVAESLGVSKSYVGDLMKHYKQGML